MRHLDMWCISIYVFEPMANCCRECVLHELKEMLPFAATYPTINSLEKFQRAQLYTASMDPRKLQTPLLKVLHLLLMLSPLVLLATLSLAANSRMQDKCVCFVRLLTVGFEAFNCHRQCLMFWKDYINMLDANLVRQVLGKCQSMWICRSRTVPLYTIPCPCTCPCTCPRTRPSKYTLSSQLLIFSFQFHFNSIKRKVNVRIHNIL